MSHIAASVRFRLQGCRVSGAMRCFMWFVAKSLAPADLCCMWLQCVKPRS